jgi:hypothetical protein
MIIAGAMSFSRAASSGSLCAGGSIVWPYSNAVHRNSQTARYLLSPKNKHRQLRVLAKSLEPEIAQLVVE